MTTWIDSPPDEFLETCSELHFKMRKGTLTEEDINKAIRSWDHDGYEAYNMIISACLDEELWTCTSSVFISSMNSICLSMSSESLPDSDMPLFLTDDDPIGILLQKHFRRSCYLAATTPPSPPPGTIIYSGDENDGGEGYAIFLVVKRHMGGVGSRVFWNLYEYHDFYKPRSIVRYKYTFDRGLDNYLGRFDTLAEALDNCGKTDQIPCRDLQICLCKHVESKYHVKTDDVPNMIKVRHLVKADYLVPLSSLPDDHQAAIAYVITRTRINYKSRKLPVPIGIYDVKSLSQALENWVASTMDAIEIYYISTETFKNINHLCWDGHNRIVETHERAATLLQRKWRQVCENPYHRVGSKVIIRSYDCIINQNH
jgi:hypothetical protein